MLTCTFIETKDKNRPPEFVFGKKLSLKKFFNRHSFPRDFYIDIIGVDFC